MKFGRSMGFAATVTMVSVALSRVLGLLREGLLAHQLGVGLEADAYAVAFMLPDLLNTLLAGGFLSISFLPLFVRAGKEEGDEAANRFLTGVQLLLGSLGLMGIAALWIFAQEAVTALQPGLAGTAVLSRAVHLSRILLPAQAAFLLAGAWSGAQYARKRFLFPALAPLVYNAGILAGGWFLAPWMGAEGFAWGVLLGAVLGHLILQGTGARLAGARWQLPIKTDLVKLRAFAWRTFPLMVGLTLGFSSEFLLRRMAGYLGTGSVAEASYAFRLTMVLVAFFGQAAGVSSYPFLVELASTGRLRELNALLEASIARLFTYLLPACTLSFALAPELVAFAFQRGHFDARNALVVTQLFRIQLWCVAPWCLQIVFARAFYARDRFWSTALVGTLLTALAWPLWSLLTAHLGKEGASMGLVLLVSLEAVGFLCYWLWMFPGELSLRECLARLPLPLLLSCLAGAVAWAVATHLHAPALVRLATGGTAGAALYLGLGMAFGLTGLEALRSKIGRLKMR